MNHIEVSFKTEFHGGMLTFHNLPLKIPLILEPGIRHDITIPVQLYPGWELVVSVRPTDQ